MRRKSKSWKYAVQSDPDRNPQFRRDWSQSVPVRRKPPGTAAKPSQPKSSTKR